MDKRYFVSLVILGFLVLITWSLAPSHSPTTPAENSDTTQTALIVDTTGTRDDQPAVPIIGLDSGMETSTAASRAAFDDQIGNQIQLDAIPNRSTPERMTPSKQVPSVPAAFSAAGDNSQPLDPIRTSRASDEVIEEDSSPAQRELSFSMPNVQQPLSTLPNDRRILKPIAKLNSPFASDNRPPEGPANDPVFEKFANNPAPKTPAIHRSVSSETTSGEFTRSRLPGVSNPIPNRSSRPTRDVRLDRSRYIWHVVEPSQSLQSISLQYSGDTSLVDGIVNLNSDIIEDPTLLPVGEAIRVPIRY